VTDSHGRPSSVAVRRISGQQTYGRDSVAHGIAAQTPPSARSSIGAEHDSDIRCASATNLVRRSSDAKPQARHTAPAEAFVQPGSRRRRLGHVVVGLAVAAALIVGVVALLGLGSAGPLGLVAILAGHLLLILFVLAMVGAVLTRSRAAVVGLSVVIGATLVVSGSEWLSLPPATSSGRLVTLSTWNLELGSAAADDLDAVLSASDADIVALQELTPEAVTAMEDSAEVKARYPYRSLHPSEGVLGLGLVSRFPILEAVATDDPATLAVSLDMGAKGRLSVTVAHPLPGHITTSTPLHLPVAFDASERDDALRSVRVTADAHAADGTPAVLIGDFNVSPSEPGYAVLADGWRDVHRDVGIGPGWTWRPSRFETLGLGLLRIDHVFVSPDIQPLSIGQDCSHPGDHCLVTARLQIPIR
jgi:endonuclease/exonuclease/phosphatase family metal-dependent hydrolase